MPMIDISQGGHRVVCGPLSPEHSEYRLVSIYFNSHKIQGATILEVGIHYSTIKREFKKIKKAKKIQPSLCMTRIK